MTDMEMLELVEDAIRGAHFKLLNESVKEENDFNRELRNLLRPVLGSLKEVRKKLEKRVAKVS